MFKKCSVVMLATKEKAKVNMINLAPYNREGQKLELIHYVTNGDGLNLQHLYIVSDDKIEEGDWFLSDKRDRKEQNNGKPIWKLKQCEKITNSWIFAKGEPHQGLNPDWCKKIIATTDTSLTTCQCRKVGYHKLSCKQTYNLPEPSQGFIKVFIEEYNKGSVITDVMVEYIKGEYIDGIVDCGDDDLWDSGYYKSDILKVNPKDNTITIRKLKDSWSREEVIQILKQRESDSHASFSIGIEQWIEETL